MIKYKQTKPFSIDWRRNSFHKTIDSVLESYARNFIDFKIIEQSKGFLKLEATYGKQIYLEEYWDDNFPYNSESEDSVPDWLK